MIVYDSVVRKLKYGTIELNNFSDIQEFEKAHQIIEDVEQAIKGKLSEEEKEMMIRGSSRSFKDFFGRIP